MQVAALLFDVASRGRTGTLIIALTQPPGSQARLELDRGWVYATAGPPVEKPVRGEDALRRVLRAVPPPPVDVRFVENDPPRRHGRHAPFHPAVILRNHVEATLGDGAGAALRQRADGERRVRLVYPPHPSCLGADERPLLALLAAPRTLQDLDGTRVTTPLRIERLVAFLEAVGSVRLEPDAAPLYRLLGLADDAPADEVRRAYKRLARE